MRRSLALLVMLLATVAGVAGLRTGEPALDRDFESQLRRGVTFFFFESPDQGVFITFQGSSAVLRELDGTRLKTHTDVAAFSFADGVITLKGDGLKRGTQLELRPAPRENLNDRERNVRFRLEGQAFPFGGCGPVELPHT